MRAKSVLLFFFLALISLTAAVAAPLRELQAAVETVPGEEKVWTSWDPTHYDLIDDGPNLWIGTGTGLLRYKKASSETTRFTTADGFPHRRVFTGAVDSAGNRWFAGDGGLSRLSPAEEWTYYNASNSGLFSNQVVAVAISATGDVWLGHGQEGNGDGRPPEMVPQISQRRADGSWAVFADRKEAVESTYPAIKETINANRLWAVSGENVWVGYEVYDGSTWKIRRPAESHGNPLLVAVDSRGIIWALESYRVFKKELQGWSTYVPDWWYGGSLKTIAIDGDDEVWVGGEKEEDCGPRPVCSFPAYTRLSQKPGEFDLDQVIYNLPFPLLDLQPTAAGLWATGDNWLLTAEGLPLVFSDGPSYESVSEFFIDAFGVHWVASRKAGDMGSAVQIVDDQGTLTRTDDTWEEEQDLYGLPGLEIIASGGFWLTDYPGCYHCYAWLARVHDGQFHYYAPPIYDWGYPNSEARARDIFSQDSRHTWFAYTAPSENGEYVDGILHLDDGGTPLNTEDDTWIAIDLPDTAQGSPVRNRSPVTTDRPLYYGQPFVAAVNNRLWYGDETGIYLYVGEAWQRLAHDRPLELVPARDGTLIARIWEDEVLVISPDGRMERLTIAKLVTAQPYLVRAATHRNQMWTVAPDGAVWYWGTGAELNRWQNGQVHSYSAPGRGGAIEVDRHNHAWVTVDGRLWRLSPKPDFDVASGPWTWMIWSGISHVGNIIAVDISGYTESIALSVRDLPAGISATVEPEIVHAGESAVLTLHASGVPNGLYSFTIHGTSGGITRTRSVKLYVVDFVYHTQLPLVAHGSR